MTAVLLSVLALAAPDVALAQAAIGFGLVTFVYLLAIRRTGKLVVAACEACSLLYPKGEEIRGLEWEILVRFARFLHRELELVSGSRGPKSPAFLKPEKRTSARAGISPVQGKKCLSPSRWYRPLVTLRWGEGPLAAVAGDPGERWLPPGSPIFEDEETLVRAAEEGKLGGAVVDLLRLRSWLLRGIPQGTIQPIEETAFRLAVTPMEPEVHEAPEDFLEDMERTGQWKALLDKVPGMKWFSGFVVLGLMVLLALGTGGIFPRPDLPDPRDGGAELGGTKRCDCHRPGCSPLGHGAQDPHLCPDHRGGEIGVEIS
ncbi:MAG: Na(+)/H(+) antiporter subunit B [Candidatus Bipolaricaulaceae bacterium]